MFFRLRCDFGFVFPSSLCPSSLSSTPPSTTSSPPPSFLTSLPLRLHHPLPHFSHLSLLLTPQLDMNPLQVAIIGMQNKINSLRKCLLTRPADSKLLQMLLQGGIATSVNQGPFAIAKCFLDIPLREQTHDHRRLRVCFKEFTRRSQIYLVHTTAHLHICVMYMYIVHVCE